ncbi:TIR domain-containing protein, partial [Sphingomonas sp.]|uniref:TIR domain-containing protein n=1 Tax=Sphingomonas sp. TaxID=28214 RepID=UPI0026004105
MADQAPDVFVSYKSEDRARLKPLIAALEADGLTVWWDAHIGGGANWRRDIEEKLESARSVLVAWTKRSVGPEGEFVRDEAARARQRGAYVPILLDAVRPPLGFGEVHALSLKGWKGDRQEAAYLALLDALHRRIDGPAGLPSGKSVLTRRSIMIGCAGAGAAAAGLAAWVHFKPSAASGPGSIAVLPFRNLSGDANQAYFAEGIADEIRGALTRLGGLTVIGSTSSAAVSQDDVRVAAQKLGVANILTGSVRQSPSTIRISAELIDGRTGADR